LQGAGVIPIPDKIEALYPELANYGFPPGNPYSGLADAVAAKRRNSAENRVFG
jgi:hypothetical protein